MAPPSKKSHPKKSKRDDKLRGASKKPFKPRMRQNEAVPSESLALQMEDDVPDFPRGGGSLLSRQEHDAIRAEVDAEFEAGERKTKKKNKNAKKTKKSYALEDDMGSLFGDGITGKLPRFANKITLKNISPGMKLGSRC